MNKKILFISNGFGLSPVTSGGEVRLYSIIKRLPKTMTGWLLTTEGGTIAASDSCITGLVSVLTCRSDFIFKREFSGLQRLIGYFISSLTGYAKIKQMPFDAIYTSSDFFFDINPALRYKLRNPGTKWAAMLHHLYISPFRRPGNFITNAFFYLAQKRSFKIIAAHADTAFVLDTPEGEKIGQKLLECGFKGNIEKVMNGIELKNNTEQSKKDPCLAVYVGGLRASKGLYDIVPIWKKTEKFRLDIIGMGSAKDMQYLSQEIERAGLSHRIRLLGYLQHDALPSAMQKASVFFFPSHEEGWGMSVLDALSYGLRPVTYTLPAYKHFASKLTAVKCFDTDAFAKAVTKAFAAKPGKPDMKFLKKFSWDTIAKNEFSIISRQLKGRR